MNRGERITRGKSSGDSHFFFLTFHRFIIRETIGRRVRPEGIGRRVRIARTRKGTETEARRRDHRRADPRPSGSQPGKRNRGSDGRARARGKIQISAIPESITCSGARPPPPLSALQRRNSIKVLAHGPKEMPFSRISRSLSGGTTAYVGPGATRATVLRQHGGEEPVLFVGYRKSTSQAYRHFAPLNVDSNN